VVDGEDYLFTVAIHVFDDASTFHPGIPAKSNRIPQVPSAIGSTKTRSDTTLIDGDFGELSNTQVVGVRIVALSEFTANESYVPRDPTPTVAAGLAGFTLTLN
jgi:hypothetical protein